LGTQFSRSTITRRDRIINEISGEKVGIQDLIKVGRESITVFWACKKEWTE
jgi:hypothetical protein